jgi:Uma2 family endonuclease
VISADEYLHTSYPDGDREFLDGQVVERNIGAPAHSALLAILTVHLGAFEKQLNLEVFPSCRMRISDTRYRVPDVLAMRKPFRHTNRALLDAPFLIVEILSPDDRFNNSMRRFADYQQLGVSHIVQMDPEDRTTFVFESGNLIPRDLSGFDVPDRGFLPFDSRELLAQIDDEE